MFSEDVRQFRIGHILLSFFLIGFAMALVSIEGYLSVRWGQLMLVGLIGVSMSYFVIFLSDVLDQGPIGNRNLWSRLFNSVGLAVFLITALVVFVFGLIVIFQSVLWAVDWALYWLEEGPPRQFR